MPERVLDADGFCTECGFKHVKTGPKRYRSEHKYGPVELLDDAVICGPCIRAFCDMMGVDKAKWLATMKQVMEERKQ